MSAEWWESLSHKGLMLGPAELNRVETDYPLGPIPSYRITTLRRDMINFESGKLDVGKWVSYILGDLCGFSRASTGQWKRAKDVPEEFARTLVSKEKFKPHHVWIDSHGGVLPVFIDTKNPRLGLGKGKKLVSEVTQWLRIAHRPLGLVTNGRQWRLIYAGIDFDASCDWDIRFWLEEGTLSSQVDALRYLLQPAMFHPEAEGKAMPLAHLIIESRKGQSDLSSVLGERVREAVEMLVRAHGEALKEAELSGHGQQVYRGAVRVIMRMVVVLFSESRDLLPRSNPVYHQAYSLGGLADQLKREHARGRSRLEHRYQAWPRILGLFRLIHEGSSHEVMPIPAYGGQLFEPVPADAEHPMERAVHLLETACFGTGVEVSDRVVHDILERLTRSTVRIRQGRGSTRVPVPVNFSDLSSEYIGILYEGLLDYELRVADKDDPMLFLAVGNEPALPLSRLEQMEDKQIENLFESLKKSSDDDSAASIDDEEGDEETETEEELEEDELEDPTISDEEEEPENEADSQREEALQRADAWSRHACQVAKIVKKRTKKQTDAEWDSLVGKKAALLQRRLILPGEFYLVRWGGTRKGSGTFYTRPQLAAPTVMRTLRPLAYQETKDGHWTPRKPEDILALKICDPACGSGSFPVAALRYLTEALYASLHHHNCLDNSSEQTLEQMLGIADSPESGTKLPCQPEAPDFADRTHAVLRRYVVEHCIYGVDIDPLAVELSRISLWIETMDYELPFSFLEHKILCGNSLIGCWFDQFAHYPVMAFKGRRRVINHIRMASTLRKKPTPKPSNNGRMMFLLPIWSECWKVLTCLIPPTPFPRQPMFTTTHSPGCRSCTSYLSPTVRPVPINTGR